MDDTYIGHTYMDMVIYRNIYTYIGHVYIKFQNFLMYFSSIHVLDMCVYIYSHTYT